MPRRSQWRVRRVLHTCVALVPALLLALSVSAQTPSEANAIDGVVLVNGEPVPGVPVALHRVTDVEQAQVSSALSGSDGRFRFVIAADTTAGFNVFFVTADYLAIRYFGPPIHPAEGIPSPYSVVVYDTTSVLPEPLRIGRRDVVLIPIGDGAWEIQELVSVTNPTQMALVGASGQPTWHFRIPAEATDFEAGERDFMPHQISRMEDAVMLLTPFPPGQREMLIRYRLPARPARASIPLLEPTDTFNLIVEQQSHLRSVIGLQAPTPLQVDSVTYLKYSGYALPAGGSIDFEWSAASVPPFDPILAAVLASSAFLGYALWAAFRRRGAPAQS